MGVGGLTSDEQAPHLAASKTGDLPRVVCSDIMVFIPAHQRRGSVDLGRMSESLVHPLDCQPQEWG
jgi:hypothetical protein